MSRREYPAKSKQPGPREGFEEGQERRPQTPDKERDPRFSRGQEHTGERTPEKEREPRFSRGQEHTGERTREKERERRFSEGQERHTD